MSDVRPLSDLADVNLDDDDGSRNVGKFEKQRSLQDLHGPKKRQWKPNVSNNTVFFFSNCLMLVERLFVESVVNSRINDVNYNNEVIRTK